MRVESRWREEGSCERLSIHWAIARLGRNLTPQFEGEQLLLEQTSFITDVRVKQSMRKFTPIRASIERFPKNQSSGRNMATRKKAIPKQKTSTLAT